MTTDLKPDALRAPHDVRELHRLRRELTDELAEWRAGLKTKGAMEAGIFPEVAAKRIAEIEAALAKLNEQAAKAEAPAYAFTNDSAPRRVDTTGLVIATEGAKKR